MTRPVSVSIRINSFTHKERVRVLEFFCDNAYVELEQRLDFFSDGEVAYFSYIKSTTDLPLSDVDHLVRAVRAAEVFEKKSKTHWEICEVLPVRPPDPDLELNVYLECNDLGKKNYDAHRKEITQKLTETTKEILGEEAVLKIYDKHPIMYD